MADTLYLECSAGISGDMLVAALLDAGADEAAVFAALDSLPVAGFSVKVSRVSKQGLDACDFDVVLDEAHQNHDHDMGYLYGHAQGVLASMGAEGVEDHDHEGHCGHGHGEHHGHGDEHDEGPDAHGPQHDHASHDPHDHGHHRHGHDPHGHGHHAGSSGHHEHRNLADVLAIIDGASMSEGARAIARRIFSILAEAEAKAHGRPVEEVHFHEVGAVDSIADVVAIAVAFDSLGLEEVVVPALAEGRGSVRCQHGIIPVPVPAVVNIAQAHGLPLSLTPVEGELVTPTGAAAVAALRTSGELPERFVVKRVGLGAGKRDYPTSGILRAMVIEPR